MGGTIQGDMGSMISTQPRCYRVTTTNGQLCLLGYSRAFVIQTALELTGPGAKLISCHIEGEWS